MSDKVFIIQSESQSSRKFRLRNGEVIECDSYGKAAVNEETKNLLLSEDYKFKGFKVIQGNLKPVTETDQKNIEESNLDGDQSLIDIIDGIEEFNHLKEIAKDLGIPEEQWKGYKRKDFFKSFLKTYIETKG